MLSKQFESVKFLARHPVLPDTGTSSFLITVNSLTGQGNLVINPIFGLLSSSAIQNISDMIGYP